MALRYSIWRTYASKTQLLANCLVCKKEISFENFHCGHIMAETHGGKTDLENLRPICANCNQSMGAINMFDFMRSNGFEIITNISHESHLSDQQWSTVNINALIKQHLHPTFLDRIGRMELVHHRPHIHRETWMRFLCLAWILYQSNRHSLLPIHVQIYMKTIENNVGKTVTVKSFLNAISRYLSIYEDMTIDDDCARYRLMTTE